MYPNPQLKENLFAQVEGRGLARNKVVPHFLKIAQIFENGKSALTFNLKDGFKSTEKGIAPQILLGENDIFVMSGIGLMIQRVVEAGGKYYFGNSRAFSYPDPQIFLGAAVAPGIMKENECLEAAYQGHITLNTGQVERMPALSASFFRIAPETQFNATAKTEPSTPGLVCRDTTVNYYLSGKQTNRVDWTFAEGDTSVIAGPSGVKNFAWLYCAGFTIIDGAQSPELLSDWQIGA